MELLFWLSLGLIVYVYAGYPVLLGVWAYFKGRGQRSDGRGQRSDGRGQRSEGRGQRSEGKGQRSDSKGAPGVEVTGTTGDLPGVTVIIAARNEARRLPGRIANILASDYPKDRLQIIVASDGSTDRTAEAVAPYLGHVELVMLPPGGKARTLNAAVARAEHPTLVFADARQQFAPDAIARLVSHFADASIGAVSGELILDCEPDAQLSSQVMAGALEAAVVAPSFSSTSTIGDGVGAYWRYEKWLRRREAIVGSMLGVTGAIYAMRRSAWHDLPPDTILDDVLGPMRMVLDGLRVVFDDQAHAFDETAQDCETEMRRKVRTLAGNFQLLRLEPRLLVPVVNPVWLQFMSHKVGRLLVPYALISLLVASASLADTSWFYLAAFAGQASFYGLAIYGAILDGSARTAKAHAAQPAPGAGHAGPAVRTDEAA